MLLPQSCIYHVNFLSELLCSWITLVCGQPQQNIKFFNFSLACSSSIPNIVYCNAMELVQDIYWWYNRRMCMENRNNVQPLHSPLNTVFSFEQSKHFSLFLFKYSKNHSTKNTFKKIYIRIPENYFQRCQINLQFKLSCPILLFLLSTLLLNGTVSHDHSLIFPFPNYNISQPPLVQGFVWSLWGYCTVYICNWLHFISQ